LPPPARSCDRMRGAHARRNVAHKCSKLSGRHWRSPLRPRSTHPPAMPSDATGGLMITFLLLCRLCSQMEAPPQSLHLLLCRLCVETNLKLFTSTRRPSQRKSACGSPQHIPNCRQKSHHLQINEGPVRRGRTQPIHENASSRPANPENASPRPPFPTTSPRDFAVAHHRTQSILGDYGV